MTISASTGSNPIADGANEDAKLLATGAGTISQRG
jgi:hypothetical protein